ncbi:DnaJ C-terminal domain-containing protein [Brachybacterium sp. DNPG3]
MSSQDWLDKDFYAVLGVSKDADAQAIKKAYRKKAKELHPDRHPDDPTAEDRFKQAGEAYSVLNDPEQRKQYDAIRAMGAGGARFNAGQGGPGGAGFEDVFSSMFGGQGGFPGTSGGGAGSGAGNPDIDDILRMFGGGAGGGAGFGGGFPGGAPRPPAKGEDISARTRISFRDAALGTELTLSVEGRSITTRIPAGVHDGQKIRLRGKGRRGQGSAPAGDLLLALDVEPHPVWTADGANLRITVPVAYDEAVLGTTLEVPLLEGGSVKLKVAPGTPSGRVLRARGKGLKTARTTGDLLVEIAVAVPSSADDRVRAAVEELRDVLAEAGEDPRAGLADAAAR